MHSAREKTTPQTNQTAPEPVPENPASAAAASAVPRPLLVQRKHTFARVPTHVVGVPQERRYHRAPRFTCPSDSLPSPGRRNPFRSPC